MSHSPDRVEIAVIGAGPAGLEAGRLLRQRGHDVVVLDKGRGPGGRMSSRRGSGVVRLDHGCQFLSFPEGTEASVRDSWCAAGVAAPWRPVLGPGSGQPHLAGDDWLIGMPTMSAIPKHLARDLDVRCRHRITALEPDDTGWLLRDDEGVVRLRAKRVLLAIPAPQAAALLEPVGFTGLDLLASVVYQANWTLLVDGEDLPAAEFEAVAPEEGPLGWVVNQASKPGRDPRPAWIAQASDDWSTTHLEDEAEAVRRALGDALSTLLGRPLGGVGTVHRWRHGIVRRAVGTAVVTDEARGLAACGDWCLGPTVGHAILSGRAAAAHFD